MTTYNFTDNDVLDGRPYMVFEIERDGSTIPYIISNTSSVTLVIKFKGRGKYPILKFPKKNKPGSPIMCKLDGRDYPAEVYENLRVWTVDGLTHSSGMFAGCTKFRGPEISNWKYTSLIDASGMFEGCKELDANLSFDVPNLENASYMFSGCEMLLNVRISIKSIKNMTGMFQDCPKIYQISSIYPHEDFFDTVIADTTDYMFRGCTSFNQVVEITSSSLESTKGMFEDCRSLNSKIIIKCKNPNNTTSMFKECVSLKTVPVITTYQDTDAPLMFGGRAR